MTSSASMWSWWRCLRTWGCFVSVWLLMMSLAIMRPSLQQQVVSNMNGAAGGLMGQARKERTLALHLMAWWRTTVT